MLIKNSALSATLGVSLLVGSAAFAESQVVAKSGDSLAEYLTNEGIEFEETKDDVGDPKFDINHYGVEFSVFFYGCDDGADCNAIQFFSGYDTDGGIRISKLNQWNAENRYSRAYVASDGGSWIEHDVFLGKHGMHPDDFASLLSIWSRAQTEFEEFIDW